VARPSIFAQRVRNRAHTEGKDVEAGLARQRALDVLAGVGSQHVPLVGGAITGLLAGERARTLQRDWTERTDELAERLLSVEGALDRIFATAVGRDAFTRVVGETQVTASEARRRYLANALLNGYASDKEFEEREFFLDLALKYRPVHVEWLRSRAENKSGIPSFDSIFRIPTDHNLPDRIRSELLSDGLVTLVTYARTKPKAGLTVGDTGQEIEERGVHRVTNIGRDFLEFLTTP